MDAGGTHSADVILVGGGLANGLIALRLAALRPELKVVMVERGRTIGGEHTWSHFRTDVSEAIDAWLAPLIVHRWEGYDVRFPAHARQLSTPYRAVTSGRLHQLVSAALGDRAWLGVDVVDVSPNRVRLGDGRSIEAPTVIDGRGARKSPALALGWQKFVGQEVVLAQPHGLLRPIIMDASVPQLDGYRFVYVLPFGANRLLIEDTRYSDAADLDRDVLRADIAAYAAAQGWTILSVEREEDGVLPIALAGDIDAFWKEAKTGVPQAGLLAALFQPVTGYSLPDAARLADEIAALPDLTSQTARAAAEARSKAAWNDRGFYRLLNRMLFRACAPGERYKVLERFYRLPRPLIERFYAAQATFGDKARILTGKPPVPVGAALKVLSEASVMRAA